jgi:hypothetical protein
MQWIEVGFGKCVQDGLKSGFPAHQLRRDPSGWQELCDGLGWMGLHPKTAAALDELFARGRFQHEDDRCYVCHHCKQKQLDALAAQSNFEVATAADEHWRQCASAPTHWSDHLANSLEEKKT